VAITEEAIKEALKRPTVTVERQGLGFAGTTFPSGPVLRFDHLRESRGEVHGELYVANATDPELLWGSFNLSSLSARSTTAKFLGGRDPVPNWPEILERFCIGVLRLHREHGLTTIGGPERKPVAARMMLKPLLAVGKPTIVFAPGGHGKSTLAVAVAVAVQTGTEIIPGMRPDPSLTAPVLVLDWEEDEDAWDAQLRAVCAGAGIRVPVVQYQPCAGALADQVEEISELVAEHCIGLVIVDSVEAACGSGREHEGWNERAQRLMDALRELRVASLLLDHVAGTDIGQDTPANKMIGAVAKINRARSVFELRAEKEPTADRIELVLRDTKRNGRARVPTMSFATVFEDFDESDTARRIRYERCEVQAPELVSRLSLADQISRALRSGAMTVGAVAGELDAKPAVIRAILNRNKERFAKLPLGPKEKDSRWGLVQHE
jgi:hypothetical protein